MALSFEHYLTTEDNSDINEDIENEIRKELHLIDSCSSHELGARKLRRDHMQVVSPGLDVLYEAIFDNPAREQAMVNVEGIRWVIYGTFCRTFHAIDQVLLEKKGYNYDMQKLKEILAEEHMSCREVLYHAIILRCTEKYEAAIQLLEAKEYMCESAPFKQRVLYSLEKVACYELVRQTCVTRLLQLRSRYDQNFRQQHMNEMYLKSIQILVTLFTIVRKDLDPTTIFYIDLLIAEQLTFYGDKRHYEFCKQQLTVAAKYYLPNSDRCHFWLLWAILAHKTKQRDLFFKYLAFAKYYFLSDCNINIHSTYHCWFATGLYELIAEGKWSEIKPEWAVMDLIDYLFEFCQMNFMRQDSPTTPVIMSLDERYSYLFNHFEYLFRECCFKDSYLSDDILQRSLLKATYMATSTRIYIAWRSDQNIFHKRGDIWDDKKKQFSSSIPSGSAYLTFFPEHLSDRMTVGAVLMQNNNIENIVFNDLIEDYRLLPYPDDVKVWLQSIEEPWDESEHFDKCYSDVKTKLDALKIGGTHISIYNIILRLLTEGENTKIKIISKVDHIIHILGDVKLFESDDKIHLFYSTGALFSSNKILCYVHLKDKVDVSIIDLSNYFEEKKNCIKHKDDKTPAKRKIKNDTNIMNDLIKPLEEWLGSMSNSSGKRQSLKIAADDELAFQPFSTFSINGKRLIENFNISYTMLPELHMICYSNFRNNSVPVAVFLFAASQERKDLGLRRLVNTEINSIGNILKGCNFVFESATTKTILQNFLEQLAQSNHKEVVFHFGGHAKPNSVPQNEIPTNYGFSGCLVLDVEKNIHTQSNSIINMENIDSTLLFAREIRKMDLTKVRLAILNACNSFTSPVASKSSHTGLARAFLAAGVQCVIATLDEVNDYVANQFTEYLYQNLHEKGLTIGDAFADAIDQIRTHEYIGLTALWSPYIIYGNSDVRLNFLKN